MSGLKPFSQPSSPHSRRSFLRLAGLTGAALSFHAPDLFAAPTPTSPALVTTPLGKLRGETAPDGIRIFRGVPFAQPPVGPLRFLPPLPPKPWPGTRDATTFAAPAMQPDDPPSSEDCLYLNIWTPATHGPHPVFLWIHGGGYTGGRAFDPLFDGSRFARDGVVLVTVAYRLGVFGFMDLSPLLGPQFADSANNAMRDLVASLKWVAANIAAFGGDPARITVGGESAGAKATAALMAIPEASALFHSAISESGGGERVLTLSQAAAFAQTFGSEWRQAHPLSAPSPSGFADLLTAPAAALIRTQTHLIEISPLHFPFRPQAGGALLPRRPVDLVAAGSASGKRLLIGTNRDENALFLGARPPADPTARDLGNLPISRFNEVFPRYLAIYPNLSPADRRIRAVTAEEYWVPSVRLADAQARNDGPTWMYRLDYAKPSGPMANQAYHSLDLGLLWERPDKLEAADPAALQLSHAMHQAWIAFIRGESPSAPALPAWPRYDPDTRSTMILSTRSHVEQQPFADELRLWEGIL